MGARNSLPSRVSPKIWWKRSRLSWAVSSFGPLCFDPSVRSTRTFGTSERRILDLMGGDTSRRPRGSCDIVAHSHTHASLSQSTAMLFPTPHRLRRHMKSRRHLGTRPPRWAQA